MAMKILSDNNPQDTFLTASNILTDAVKHTLGPNGLNTAVCTDSSGFYQIINDGKSIVQDLTSDDPVLAPALETLKQSCFETNRKAGDGTTSTILMTNSLLKETLNYIKQQKSNNILKIRDTLLDCRDELINAVNTQKIDITEDKYEDVATVALGSNKYSKLVADAFKFVGTNGNVSYMKEDIRDITIEKQDGITLTKAQLPIVNVVGDKEFVDLNCVILYEKIDRFSQLINLLNYSAEQKKKTLLFYNELSWDTRSNLYTNIQSGAIDVLPIRLGGYGINIKDLMDILSSYTQTKVIDGASVKLSTIKDFDNVFGNVNTAFVSNNSIIINAPGEIKKVKENMFTLSSKSCIIKIGGYNKVEQEENYRRIEDAINSLSSAIQDGIISGGGLAYINACESLDMTSFPDYISNVLSVVYRTIIYNMCGVDKIPEEYLGLFPDNKGEFTDLDESVFDSASVIKEVINNSFTLVAQIITTEKIIHEMIR